MHESCPILGTDQHKVTLVVAAQVNWSSWPPISSPQPAVSKSTWREVSALGQCWAGGGGAVDDWRPGENLSSSSVGVKTQPILCKDTCTMLEQICMLKDSLFDCSHIVCCDAHHRRSQYRPLPPVRAVICGGCASEKLFSKASKAQQQMTFRNCHLSCYNGRAFHLWTLRIKLAFPCVHKKATF